MMVGEIPARVQMYSECVVRDRLGKFGDFGRSLPVNSFTVNFSGNILKGNGFVKEKFRNPRRAAGDLNQKATSR